MRPHVSYSEISSFANECQWRWKLDYLEQHRSAQKHSIHFDFGTAVHAALEAHKRRKSPIGTDHAITLFEKKFRWLYKNNSAKYDRECNLKEFRGLVESGKNILLRLEECEELAQAEVVHNEFRLFEEIGREDDTSVKFKGYIDLVIKTKDKRGNTILYVCDFKTCSWGWSREQRDDRWKQYQLFLYKHFLCKKFDIDPKLVRVAFILLKKRPPKNAPPVEFFPVSAGPVSVQRALDTLGSVVTEMAERSKTGDFVKNRSCCTDKYGNNCPYFKTALCPE